uniref:Zgc:162780 n=1 Tax=Seriola dumerili TaxID=41447 RepID=A0A3B4U7G4_SERDU
WLNRLFEGKEHAASYWKYRISPSDHLIQQKGRPFELAVDVGCGSGQGTLLLAKHFASVVGTDVSPAQLEVALQHVKEPNITYNSVDLMTAMSAFHWFDRPRFLRESTRLLLAHAEPVVKEVLTEYSPERGDRECALKHTQPHLQMNTVLGCIIFDQVNYAYAGHLLKSMKRRTHSDLKDCNVNTVYTLSIGISPADSGASGEPFLVMDKAESCPKQMYISHLVIQL